MKLHQLLITMVIVLLLMACKNGDVSSNREISMMEVKCYSGGQVVMEDRTTQVVFARAPHYISEKTKRKVWLTSGMSCTISEV